LLPFDHSRDHRALHSFPTRRSSDLGIADPLDAAAEDALDRFRAAGDGFVDPGKAVHQLAVKGTGALIERAGEVREPGVERRAELDRKSTRLNSSHVKNSYAVFCLKK